MEERSGTLRKVVVATGLVLAFGCLLSSSAVAAKKPKKVKDTTTWLCKPGIPDNPCEPGFATTVVSPTGQAVGTTTPKADRKRKFDCFYVYPTVSNDPDLNSDLVVDNSEKSAVQVQFARFAGVCRTFAPIYRQMTLTAVAKAATGGDVKQPAIFAYADVVNAWRTYLAKYNQGRPFVLIGHSQGSLMLQELIKHEIEGKPIAKQMRLAILPGFNLYVPQGKRVGGTLKSTPICGSPGETGCVMTWVSVREKNVPPAGATFGRAEQPGFTVACTNPARPGSAAWEPLDSYWNTKFGLAVPGGPIEWSTEGTPPTQFVRTEGLVSARCVSDGQLGYLSIRTNADPKDKRTDRVYGEVSVFGMFIPGWGMHLADVAEAQGDMIRRVEEIGAHR